MLVGAVGEVGDNRLEGFRVEKVESTVDAARSLLDERGQASRVSHTMRVFPTHQASASGPYGAYRGIFGKSDSSHRRGAACCGQAAIRNLPYAVRSAAVHTLERLEKTEETLC